VRAVSRTLSRDVLRDKIRGAWAGQMIGVAYGAPTEFKSLGKVNEGHIKSYPLTNVVVQVDLYGGLFVCGMSAALTLRLIRAKLWRPTWPACLETASTQNL
jgi:hypothetical protein